MQHGGRFGARCGGRLHLIDIGISAAYDGALGAWECAGGEAAALYPSGRVVIPLADGEEDSDSAGEGGAGKKKKKKNGRELY